MGVKKEKRRFLDKFVRRSVARGTRLIFRVASPFLENFVSRHSQVRTHWKYLPELERWNINTIFVVLVEHERMLGYRAERRRGRQWRGDGRRGRGRGREEKRESRSPHFLRKQRFSQSPHNGLASRLVSPFSSACPMAAKGNRIKYVLKNRPIDHLPSFHFVMLFARRASSESLWLLFNVLSKHSKLCRVPSRMRLIIGINRKRRSSFGLLRIFSYESYFPSYLYV